MPVTRPTRQQPPADATSRPRPVLRLAALVAAAAAASAGAGPRPLAAQQTIINIPSVDQTVKGKFFFLHESQVRDWGGESFWQTTHFFTYGLTKRFELALTAYNIGTPFSRGANVGLGWKTAQPLVDVFPEWGRRSAFGRWNPTIGAGQMVPVSMRGRGVGVWSYAQGAVTVPRLGLRVMSGVSNGPPNLFGKHTTHFISSYELPLHGLGHRMGGRVGGVVEHMSLLGEWWSGRHDFADFVPGVNYHTKSLVVIAGYKLGNTPGTRGDGIIFEIGRTF